jgi:hypothetical protein
MACIQYLNSIQELVDGTIGAIRRAELELHLDQCADCRALVEDLDRVREAAEALPVLEPPVHIWPQIAGMLRQEGRIHDTAPAPAAQRAYPAWLAAAAAILIAAGASAYFLLPGVFSRSPAASPAVATASAPGNAAASRSVEDAQNTVDQAQLQFEKAISNLESVAKTNEKVLDASTSATIDKNLGIIDQAIAENRAAVKTEPTSVAARETLFEALRQKVSLLEDTIALINEMRKGNNAAAAQLVNKS